MKRSDIADDHVIELAERCQRSPSWEGLGVIDALIDEGVPYKVALAKVLHMSKRGLLDYGVSPNFAWSTQRKEKEIAETQPDPRDLGQ